MVTDTGASTPSGGGEAARADLFPTDLELCKLVTSQRLALESADDQWVTILQRATGARAKVSREVYDFLRTFETPKALAELGLGANQIARNRTLLLLRKGFLLKLGEPEQAQRSQRCTPAPQSLFNCPAYDWRDDRTDVAVLGVPYDLGGREPVNSRAAPSLIRQQSSAFGYSLDFRTGRPKGWHDADRGVRILEGASIRDCGDVIVEYGEPQSALFDRIEALVGDLRQADALPVLLGGDQTISYPAIRGLQSLEDLVVVCLSAEVRFDHAGGAIGAFNVGSHIKDLPNVKRVVQVGARGYAPVSDLEPACEQVRVPLENAPLAEYVDSVLQRTPEGLPIFMVVDLDVLDPTYAPGRTRPSPGGFSLTQLKAVLGGLGASRSVAGLSLVGMEPARDLGPLSAITACHVLLAALDGAMAGRARG